MDKELSGSCISSVSGYLDFVFSLIKQEKEIIRKRCKKMEASLSSLEDKLKGIKNDVEINNFRTIWEVFEKRLKFFKNNINCLSKQIKFYYRGHSDEKYFLLPGILRDGKESKEDFLYNEIQIRNPNVFVNATYLQKLAIMQHYGCPTRLLDVTANPLVALYFACKDTKDENTGEVIVFAPFEKEILSFDSDKAMILSCLAKFSKEEKAEILTKSCEAIAKDEGVLRARCKIVKKLYHELKRENSTFENCIDPTDVISSFFVQPLKDSERIIKQDGAFVLCGLSIDWEELQADLNNFIVERIKITNKQNILDELDILGINEATLFPEVDHVANYLTKKYLTS